jgi:aspartate 1-decarboxylase
VGDLVIIAAFGMVHEDKLDEAVPKLVFPDAANRIVETRSEPAGPQAGDPVTESEL